MGMSKKGSQVVTPELVTNFTTVAYMSEEGYVLVMADRHCD